VPNIRTSAQLRNNTARFSTREELAANQITARFRVLIPDSSTTKSPIFALFRNIVAASNHHCFIGTRESYTMVGPAHEKVEAA
jgi:hypothetical protein